MEAIDRYRKVIDADKKNPCKKQGFFLSISEGWSDRADVSGLRPLFALALFILNSLVFAQCAESIGDNAGMMDKEVLRTVVGRNESETLGVIEPFDFSC